LDPPRVKAFDGQSSGEEIGEPLGWNTELAPYAMMLASEAESDFQRGFSEIQFLNQSGQSFHLTGAVHQQSDFIPVLKCEAEFRVRLCWPTEKDIPASKGKGHGELKTARHIKPMPCIGNVFAQFWKRIALDCVKDAEPLKVPGEDFVKPGKGLGQRRSIKKVLWCAETSSAFQKNISFPEQGLNIRAEEVRRKYRGSAAEEL
jgi:hypothetical protein